MITAYAEPITTFGPLPVNAAFVGSDNFFSSHPIRYVHSMNMTSNNVLQKSFEKKKVVIMLLHSTPDYFLESYSFLVNINSAAQLTAVPQ